MGLLVCRSGFVTFLFSGFTIEILRGSGKVPVCSELLQLQVNGWLIMDEQAFKILLIISWRDEFFDFRVCIVLLVTASVVGIVLIPGNLKGNEY
jgi:hypothetical protein